MCVLRAGCYDHICFRERLSIIISLLFIPTSPFIIGHGDFLSDPVMILDGCAIMLNTEPDKGGSAQAFIAIGDVHRHHRASGGQIELDPTPVAPRRSNSSPSASAVAISSSAATKPAALEPRQSPPVSGSHDGEEVSGAEGSLAKRYGDPKAAPCNRGGAASRIYLGYRRRGHAHGRSAT